jgi:hypothetical protein
VSPDAETRAIMAMANRLDDVFANQRTDYCAAALSLQIVKLAVCFGHTTPEAISKWTLEELIPHVHTSAHVNHDLLARAAKLQNEAAKKEESDSKKGLRVVPSN